jgi:serine/threonine protein phosphatase 1
LKDIHLGFFENARLFYIDEEARLFVHAGFDWKIPFDEQKEIKETLLWDRTLFAAASVYSRLGKRFDEFSEIFIGHTPTQVLGKSIPLHFSNLWMMDTGICHGGKLTIMDIEEKKYWQSK